MILQKEIGILMVLNNFFALNVGDEPGPARILGRVKLNFGFDTLKRKTSHNV